MPRGVKGSGKAVAKVEKHHKGSKARKSKQSTDSVDLGLAAAEAQIIAKYPDRQFKAGSLLPAGGDPDFGNKRTIIIYCEDCKAERRVATSDVFHVSRCLECHKKARSKKAKGANGKEKDKE